MRFSRWLTFWLTLGLMILVSACSTGSNPKEVTQDKVKITFVTEPDPPRVGDGNLRIYVTNLAGQPINNLKIDVSMDMTSMSMGAQVGLADEQDKGRYSFNVIFHRQGEYKVQLWVRQNGNLIKQDEIKFQVN